MCDVFDPAPARRSDIRSVANANADARVGDEGAVSRRATNERTNERDARTTTGGRRERRADAVE